MKSIQRCSKFFLVLFLIAIVFTVVPLVGLNAQTVESKPSQAEMAKSNLEPFAGAYKEVSKIHTTYEERIVQSGDKAQVDVLQQEANKKMNQAVTDHGLTLTDYNMIFRAIKSDPVLREEFMTVLNQTPSKN